MTNTKQITQRIIQGAYHDRASDMFCYEFQNNLWTSASVQGLLRLVKKDLKDWGLI